MVWATLNAMFNVVTMPIIIFDGILPHIEQIVVKRKQIHHKAYEAHNNIPLLTTIPF